LIADFELATIFTNSIYDVFQEKFFCKGNLENLFKIRIISITDFFK
jgi:hypothetical protein